MFRMMCKSKIHRATVTEANLAYTGSITIDKALLRYADIYPFEKVQVANITNGARLETYAIEGEENSGVICMNGAAARLAQPGDEIIIISYAGVEENDLAEWKPKLVHVNKANRMTRIEHMQVSQVLESL